MNLVYLFILIFGIIDAFYAGLMIKNNKFTAFILFVSGVMLIHIGLNNIT